MRLLKSETETRYRIHPEHAREDDPMHPEQLCDHDIMMWRSDRYAHFGRHGEGDPYTHLQPARINDISGPTRDVNTRTKTFEKITEQIHRNFT